MALSSGSTGSTDTVRQDHTSYRDHLSPPKQRFKPLEDVPPYKPPRNDYISLNMMETIRDTPAALKGMSDQAWAEFQEARRRVEAAFRRAQPEPRPVAFTVPSAQEIARVLEPDNVSEDYPSIETQMNSEDCGSLKDRPMLSRTSSAEAVRAKRKTGRSTDDETVVRTKSLPTIDRKLQQACTAAFERFDGPQHASWVDEAPDFPRQIRLRKPSVPRVRSKIVEGIFAGPNVSTSTGTHRKASLVQAATTRTAVHIFMPDEQVTGQQPEKRKLSATLQVVRSRDSVYEVIWEDSLSLQTVEDAELTPELAGRSENLLGSKKVDTKLAAWSWGFDPTHIYVYEGTSSDPASHTASRIPAVGKQEASHTKPSSLPASIHESSSSEDETQSLLLDDGFVQRRRSSAPTGKLEAFADAVEQMGTPRVPSAITKSIGASKRRELLGRRKPSEAILDNAHFKEHRDSLVLAHERIFHEDGFETSAHEKSGKDMKKVRVPAETRVAVLKRATWKKPVADTEPQIWKAAQASPILEGTRMINNIATKVRTPDRHSSVGLSLDNRWLQLSAQDSGPVFMNGDTDKSCALARSRGASESSFLELTPKLQDPVLLHMDPTGKISDSATRSTAASRARKAATDKHDQAPRKSSASLLGGRGSNK